MTWHDHREAVMVFGAEAVNDALAHRREALAYWLAHPNEVQVAIRGLVARVESRQAARRYAAGLSIDLRRVIAGAWVGELGRDVSAALGLVREVDYGR